MRYRIVSPLCARLTGPPFEQLERCANPRSAALAAERADDEGVNAALDAVVADEMKAIGEAMADNVAPVLADYLVFSSDEVALVPEGLREAARRPTRNAKARGLQRTAYRYLQRLCAKCDTFSQFGPSAWLRIDDQTRFRPAPGIARRDVRIEIGVVRALLAAIRRDDEARAEIAPRLHPSVVLVDGDALLPDGTTAPLSEAERTLIARCDGATPAHALHNVDVVRALADRGVLRWELETPAFEVERLADLKAQVERWRPGPARDRWHAVLERLADHGRAFRDQRAPAARSGIFADIARDLDALDTPLRTAPAASRTLYRATNALVEECARDLDVTLAHELVDEVAVDAAPWLDLWRDCYNHAVAHVAARLRALVETCPRVAGRIPLPVFARHCQAHGVALLGEGIPKLAGEAFAAAQERFAAALTARVPDVALRDEIALTADDCAVVRRSFTFADVHELSLPSADLQLAAADFDGGAHEWIVAELHGPHAVLQHTFFWSCPDPDALRAAFGHILGALPALVLAEVGGGIAHVLHHYPALGDRFVYVGDQPPPRAGIAVAPRDAEVFVDITGDVRLRETSTGRLLGSLARTFRVPMGMHPFAFPLGPRSPRLRLGRVVVQRRSFTVAAADLAGLDADPDAERDAAPKAQALLVAAARLRRQHGVARHVYARPPAHVLSRTGSAGRDKDVKPFYVDLESVLALESLAHALRKHGALELVEMRPDPSSLPWREADGRRPFELRCLVLSS